MARISNGRSATLAISNVAFGDIGLYHVRIANAEGVSIGSRGASLQAGSSALVLTLAQDKFEDLLYRPESPGEAGDSTHGGALKPPDVSRVQAGAALNPIITPVRLGTTVFNWSLTREDTTQEDEPAHDSNVSSGTQWSGPFQPEADGCFIMEVSSSDYVPLVTPYQVAFTNVAERRPVEKEVLMSTNSMSTRIRFIGSLKM